MNIKTAGQVLGRKGGKKTKKLYGKQYYVDMINRRWDKYRDLKKAEDLLTKGQNYEDC